MITQREIEHIKHGTCTDGCSCCPNSTNGDKCLVCGDERKKLSMAGECPRCKQAWERANGL